jgi:hypothetical protein
MDILPTGMGIKTLKVTDITVIRDATDFIVVGDKKFYTEAEAKEEVERLNNHDNIKKINIRINTTNPNLYNMKIRDHPGLCVNNEFDPEFPKKVEDMNKKSLEDPEVIPVLIIAGNGDIANNQGYRLVIRCGRKKDVLPFLTKFDITKNRDVIKDLLNGDKYKLGNDYGGIVLRSKEAKENGVTIQNQILIEEEFFNNNPELKGNSYGIQSLRERIMEEQVQRTKSNIPKIIKEIDEKIKLLKKNNSVLDDIVSNPDKKIAKNLEQIINKITKFSPYRSDMEAKLKQELDNELIPIQIDDTLINNLPPIKYSNEPINRSTIFRLSSMKANPNMYKSNTFAEQLEGGYISTFSINNHSLCKTYNNEMALYNSMDLVKFEVDDVRGIRRLEWLEDLRNRFENILINGNVQKIVYDVTERILLNYISYDINPTDALTLKFAKYIIEQIGNDAYKSTIKASVNQFMRCNMRPTVNQTEIVRSCSQVYPDHFTFSGTYTECLNFKPRHKLIIEAYSELWTWCYLNSIAKHNSNNVYKLVGVNYLDPLIQKLLNKIFLME